MKKTNRRMTIVFVLLLLVVASPQPLAAYIDPGSGSYLLQVLVAGLLGASFAVKRFWGNIKDFFRGSCSSNDETPRSS